MRARVRDDEDEPTPATAGRGRRMATRVASAVDRLGRHLGILLVVVGFVGMVKRGSDGVDYLLTCLALAAVAVLFGLGARRLGARAPVVAVERREG